MPAEYVGKLTYADDDGAGKPLDLSFHYEGNPPRLTKPVLRADGEALDLPCEPGEAEWFLSREACADPAAEAPLRASGCAASAGLDRRATIDALLSGSIRDALRKRLENSAQVFVGDDCGHRYVRRTKVAGGVVLEAPHDDYPTLIRWTRFGFTAEEVAEPNRHRAPDVVDMRGLGRVGCCTGPDRYTVVDVTDERTTVRRRDREETWWFDRAACKRGAP